MNNKGFSFLEIIICINIGFLFIFSFIFYPTDLTKEYLSFNKNLTHIYNFQETSYYLYKNIVSDNFNIDDFKKFANNKNIEYDYIDNKIILKFNSNDLYFYVYNYE